MKRRYLKPGQKVIIIYDRSLGYLEEPGTFLRYDTVEINDITHQTPVFHYLEKETNGLVCFWVLPEDLKRTTIQSLQRQLIPLQIEVLQMAEQLNYQIPNKLKDPEIEKIAKSTLKQQLGFDIHDESWLETDLAITERERKWFNFERTNKVSFYNLIYTEAWNDIASLFNEKYKDTATVDDCRALSMKRMRYIFGSTPVRMSGNADKSAWKVAAREFEEKHRKIEDRMNAWSEVKKNKFPTVKTKKELSFYPGPYFNQMIEKIPHLFTDVSCTKIRIETVLRVITYDPQTKYLKLDFLPEIRKLIKPKEKTDKPWLCHGADYVFLIGHGENEEMLESVDGYL